MISSNSRKHNQSGICWSLFIFLVYLSDVRALLNNHPILDSEIFALFGSDPCIPGSLMVTPLSAPVPVNAAQSKVQEHQVSSTENLKTRLDDLSALEHSMAKEKTPMCLVNELARHNKIEHQYRLTGEDGPAHKKRFNVTLKLGTEEYSAEGPSIKKAQHSAASVALQNTSYRHPPPKNLKQQNRPGKGNVTPTVELNALVMKRGEPTVYIDIEIPPVPPHHSHNYYHRGMYTQAYNEPYGNYQYNSNRGKQSYRHHRNQKFNQNNQQSGTTPAPVKGFKVKLKVGEREFIGEGTTSQGARHDAASKALEVIRELPINPAAVHLPQTDNGVEPDSSSELKSPISLVHEIALKRNMTVSFDVVSEKGPPHMRTFVTKCTVGDQYEATAEGNGKKISKKRSAEKMLELLRKLPPLAPASVNVNPNRMKRKGTQNKKKPRNLIKDTKPAPESNHPKEEKVEPDSNSEDMNPISRLIQIQQAKKEKDPVYILKEERGAPRRREFLIQVSVGDTVFVGSGPNKKIAKRNAAEGLLQLLGYSSPTINVATGNAIQNQASAESHSPASNPGGPKGRQIVPGLLLMNDNKAPSSTNPHSGVSLKATAAVAKEYLSSQAAAAKENEVTTIRPSEQLDYLAQLLNFKLQYTDFRKGSHSEFLSLVSLSTDPPQVCHGSGPTTDISKDQAALNALRSLAEMGLDSITPSNKKTDTLTTNVTINASALNTSSAAHEMYLGINNLQKEDTFLNGK